MLVKFVCLLLTLNLAIHVSKETEFDREQNQNKSFSRRMSKRFTVTSPSSKVTRRIQRLLMFNHVSWQKWMWQSTKLLTRFLIVSKAWMILKTTWSLHMSMIRLRLTTDSAHKKTLSFKSYHALQANDSSHQGLWTIFTINSQLSSILQQLFKGFRSLSAGKINTSCFSSFVLTFIFFQNTSRTMQRTNLPVGQL